MQYPYQKLDETLGANKCYLRCELDLVRYWQDDSRQMPTLYKNTMYAVTSDATTLLSLSPRTGTCSHSHPNEEIHQEQAHC